MENDFYEMPYIRYQPYLIGMMMGYILFMTKGKEFKIHWVRDISVAD